MSTVALYVRLPEPLRDQLREIARARGTTLNTVAVTALTVAAASLRRSKGARK